MNALQRILLAGLLLSVASCSNPQACETTGECDGRDDTRGYVCTDGVCSVCEADADCADESAYGPGATCQDGRCSPGCTPGEEACVCAVGSTCAAGLECRDGTCSQPTTGCDGCPCGAGGSCDDGLICESGTCTGDCPPGTDGCPCYPGGACDGGLSCDAATSTCEPCTPGESMCACGSGGACEGDLVCSASAMCPSGTAQCCIPSSCTEGTVGCTCATGDSPCSPGAVCRGGLCVCGDNFTGPSCEISCTDTQLMLSTDPVFNPGADQGFWLCGHFAASDQLEVSTGGYSLRGEIPFVPTNRATLRGGTFTVTSR